MDSEIFLYEFNDESIFDHKTENENRRELKFTDVILRLKDGSEFPVHKVIISSRCPYFRALFDSGLKESFQDLIQLDRDISGENFEEILEYIYTGRIKITFENARIFNKIAVFLELKKLKKIAADVLGKTLKVQNSLELWEYAKTYLNNELEVQCFEFILKNAEKFLESFILDLTFEQVEKITSDYRVDCPHEILFHNLMNWMKNDFNNREKHMETLLKNVNFAKISNKFKENKINSDESLMSNVKFLNIYVKNPYIQNFPAVSISKCNLTEFVKRQEIIFAISANYIFMLAENSIIPRLIPIFMLPNSINGKEKIIPYNRDLILFSDLAGLPEKSFSFETKTLSDFPAMKEKRSGHGLLEFNGKIYACGGGQTSKRSTEIYDIQQGIWSVGPKVGQYQTEGFEMSECNGSIFTLGGTCSYSVIDNKYSKIFKSVQSKIVQRFDPRDNIWTIINNDLKIPNLKRTLSYDNQIYCFSSSNKKNIFDTRMNNLIDCPEIANSKLFLFDPNRSCVSDIVLKNGFFYHIGKQGSPFIEILDYKNLTTTLINDIDLSSCQGSNIKILNLQLKENLLARYT